ncbi:MAG: retropepsin-like aspartic protease [Polyangiaceae bacterium]
MNAPRLATVVLVALVTACGSVPAAKPSAVAEVVLASDPPPPQPKALAPLPNRHAKLTFELGPLAPLPLVHGTIGGVPTWMIVDSGAGTHFVMGWMADRANVQTSPTKTVVTDHVRREMNVALADRSLIVIEGWGGLTPGELLVVDAPAGGLGAKNNIGIMLSPQTLDDDRAVIFELDRGSIRTGTEADAVRALAARKVPVDPDDIAFCHDVFSVAANIDGHAVRLVVDTGASSTDLFSLSDAGRALAAHSASSRTAGEPASGPVAMRIAKGARIQLGALSMHKDVDILVGAPEIECPVDGVLGVDVLRSCVLVFGSGKGQLRMQCGE